MTNHIVLLSRSHSETQLKVIFSQSVLADLEKLENCQALNKVQKFPADQDDRGMLSDLLGYLSLIFSIIQAPRLWIVAMVTCLRKTILGLPIQSEAFISKQSDITLTQCINI